MAASKVGQVEVEKKKRLAIGGTSGNENSMLEIYNAVVKNEWSWDNDWKDRDNGLRKQGYSNYRQYLMSEYWQGVRKDYEKSRLLQKCMMCHDQKFVLHHTDYRHLGEERLERFLPLCETHHKKLHTFLAEYSVPVEMSFSCLRFCVGRGLTRSHFNRKVWPYLRGLLSYSLSKLGMTWEVRPYCSGTRTSKKKDKKIIKIMAGNKVKRVIFNANKGDVRLHVNARPMRLDVFCDKVSKLI